MSLPASAATTYRLLLDGQPMPPEVLEAVQQVEVEENTRLAGMVRLRLALAVTQDGSAWDLLDRPVFPRLLPIQVEARVGSRTQRLMEAHVVEVRARIAGDPGASALDVVAMDATALMGLEEKVRAWPDMADGDIAQQIFSDHGLEADVEATQPVRQSAEATTLQRGTDIAFLRHLARRNGFEAYVESDPDSGKVTGHFHPPRLGAQPLGVLTVNMGGASNVDRLEARHHMMRPAAAKAHAVSAASVEAHQAEAAATALPLLGKTALPEGTARTVLLAATGAAEPGELAARVQAAADQSAWAVAVEGELNTAAYPDRLRAWQQVLLRGAGQRLSGRYRVERVLHTFTPEGYTQRFSLARNALDLRGDEDFTKEAGR